jgi:hypothetical protein
MMALVSVGVDHGYGLHLRDIAASLDREPALTYTFIATSTSVLASTFGKVSMVLFNLRLLDQSAIKVSLWPLYTVITIMISVNVFAFGILLGGYTPMEKIWNPEISGSCIDPAVFDYAGRIQSVTPKSFRQRPHYFY